MLTSVSLHFKLKFNAGSSKRKSQNKIEPKGNCHIDLIISDV